MNDIFQIGDIVGIKSTNSNDVIKVIGINNSEITGQLNHGFRFTYSHKDIINYTIIKRKITKTINIFGIKIKYKKYVPYNRLNITHKILVIDHDYILSFVRNNYPVESIRGLISSLDKLKLELEKESFKKL